MAVGLTLVLVGVATILGVISPGRVLLADIGLPVLAVAVLWGSSWSQRRLAVIAGITMLLGLNSNALGWKGATAGFIFVIGGLLTALFGWQVQKSTMPEQRNDRYNIAVWIVAVLGLLVALGMPAIMRWLGY